MKGISWYANELIKKFEKIDKDIVSFVENSLFITLTNVNFDSDVHESMLRHSQEMKKTLRSKISSGEKCCEQAAYNLSETRSQMLEDAKVAGIMYDETINADIRSLRQTII